MSQPVISDAGPLIGLARAGLLEVLRQLYDEVLVPTAVFAELKTAEDRPGAQALREAHGVGWLREEPVRRTRELVALEKLADRVERRSRSSWLCVGLIDFFCSTSDGPAWWPAAGESTWSARVAS